MKETTHYADILGFLGDISLPLFDEKILEQVTQSGVRLIHLTSAMPFLDWRTTREMHCRTRSNFEKYSDLFRIILDRDDLEGLKGNNRIGVILGLQCPDFIGHDLTRVATLYQEGVRVLQVGYQAENLYGYGFMADMQDKGLTGLGKEYVAAINQAGIILDLSHIAPRTALDCVRFSSGPVMISHTTSRAVYDHFRGSTDEVLKTMAGLESSLVGVLGMTFFLDHEDNGLSPMLHHIRHMAEILGTEKLAIGSDGPVGGFADLKAAERLFFEKMQKKLDPRGELFSRWPTHIPELFDTTGGFDILQKNLLAYFDPAQTKNILGRNAFRFFSQALS